MVQEGIKNMQLTGCLYSVEWNSGMEWWNSRMTTPIDRVLSRPIPSIFQSCQGKPVVSAVFKEAGLSLIQQRD